jgi:hypothetical protein
MYIRTSGHLHCCYLSLLPGHARWFGTFQIEFDITVCVTHCTCIRYFRFVLITILHVQTYPDAELEASMLNPSTPLGSDIVHKSKLDKKEK